MPPFQVVATAGSLWRSQPPSPPGWSPCWPDLSAPGGGADDSPDNTLNYANLSLAAAAESLVRADNQVDEDGVPTVPSVVRDCQDGTCAYYQYLQGTSMAAPHAAGWPRWSSAGWASGTGSTQAYGWIPSEPS